jgi:hypothetical protein
MDEVGLPSVLAGAEFIDASPEDEVAFAEGDANIAAGRFTRFESDIEFEAYLDGMGV